MSQVEQTEKLRAKAKFESRRGMLELDVFLRPFAQARSDTWDTEKLSHYLEFLEAPDPDLFAWLMGYEPPPPKFVDLVQEIRRFRSQSM